MSAGLLSIKWQKAAVIGSIWAAIEIVAGSFLHNLRIPFAGMLLATASVFLLISFLHLWKENGIIIRAGLICALMKSVSPSAIIFGPMIGIFTEALIIEGVLLLLGKTRISFAVAGGLAVVWALLQKILNLLILYGFDLIKLVESLYGFLQNQTGLQQFSLLQLLVAVALLYFFAGASAAILAMISAQSAAATNKPPALTFNFNNRSGSIITSGSDKYRIGNLILLFAVMVFLLLAINQKWTIVAVSGAFVYVFFCVVRYRQSMRQLQKPALWIQFVVITAAAVFTWEWVSGGTFFSTKGLYVALDMNLRAMVLIFGFAAIGVELRNPLLHAMFSKRGAQPLYAAMNLSFSVLPAIIEQLPHPAAFFRKRKMLMNSVLGLAQQLLIWFNLMNGNSRHILITGEVHAGKTSFVKDLSQKLKEKNFALAGFLALADFENGQRTGYYLFSLTNGQQLQVAASSFRQGWEKKGKFWFNPQAFEQGTKWLENELIEKTSLVIIDEIGPLELAGQGWNKLLRYMNENSNSLQLWVVRRPLVNRVIEEFHLKNPAVVEIESTTTDELLSLLIQYNMQRISLAPSS